MLERVASPPRALLAPPRPIRREHLIVADVLRAVAILAVVCGHLSPVLGGLDRYGPRDTALEYFGVDAFFVLSGFLLGRPFIEAILGGRSFPDVRLYAQRRLLRIYPAYAFVLIVSSLAVDALGARRPVSGFDLAAHLGLVQNIFPAYVQDGVNNALWTMAVDAQFYLALPLIAAFALRFGPSEFSRRCRSMVSSLALIALGSMAWRIYAVSAFPAATFADSEFTWQRNLLGMGFCFASGCGLGLASALGARPGPRGRLAALVVGAFALEAMLLLTSTDHYRDRYALVLLDVSGTLAATMLLLGFAHDTRLVKLLGSSSIVRAVTAGSYALYLVHFPLRSAVYALVVHAHLTIGTAAGDAAYLLVFCALAALATTFVHRVVEAPFLALKERRREAA